MNSARMIIFIMSLTGTGVLLGPCILALLVKKWRSEFPKVAIPFAACLLAMVISALAGSEKDQEIPMVVDNESEEEVISPVPYIPTNTVETEPNIEPNIASNTKPSISPDNNTDIYQDLYNEMAEKLESDERLISVSNANRNIQINTDISNVDTSVRPYSYIIDDVVGMLTDVLLKYPEYDDLWDTVTVDFGEFGSVTNNKFNIVEDELGRYFEPDTVSGIFETNSMPFEKLDDTSKEIYLTSIVASIVGEKAKPLVYYWEPTNTTKIEFCCDSGASKSEVNEVISKILTKISPLVDTRIVFSLEKYDGNDKSRYLDAVFFDKIKGVSLSSINSESIPTYSDYWQEYASSTDTASDILDAYIEAWDKQNKEKFTPYGLNYNISRSGNTIILNIWAEGIAVDVAGIMLGAVDKSVWETFKEDVYTYAYAVTYGLSVNGINDAHTMVNIVNDANFENTLLTYYDGVLVYDYLQ